MSFANKLTQFLLVISMAIISSITISSCAVACGQSNKVEYADKEIGKENEQLILLDAKEGFEYVVDKVIDLEGKRVQIPPQVLITFKNGGAFINGTLIGNGTQMIVNNNDALGVKLNGSWRINNLSDEVFSRKYLNDSEIINNLNIVQSDTVINNLSITRDYVITIPKSGGKGLQLSSNTSLHIAGSLTLKPNDHKSYNIIDINGKKNVTIEGGLLVGDVGKHTYIKGNSSEWGMGININKSKNVSISDMVITRCTGDGIYITGGKESSVGIYDNASNNISIRNVKCDANRRQGLSVIHVDGLTVNDCSFINTGQIEFTGPGAGIDIEPNVKNNNNMSVRNVLISNCVIANNKGPAVSTSNTYENNGLMNFENLLFTDCKTDGLLKAQSTDLIFRNCEFKEVRFASVYAPTRIMMEDCTIEGGYGIMLYVPSGHAEKTEERLLDLYLKGCTISASADATETNALISCYKKDVPNLKNVRIENCNLKIPKKKSDSFGLTSSDFKGRLEINNSTINIPGRDLDANGIRMKGNRIYCRAAEKIGQNDSNLLFLE